MVSCAHSILSFPSLSFIRFPPDLFSDNPIALAFLPLFWVLQYPCGAFIANFQSHYIKDRI